MARARQQSVPPMVGTVILSGQDQIFKKNFPPSAETKNDKGDPYLVTTVSRPRAVLSSANSAKPTARGGTCAQGAESLNLVSRGVPLAIHPPVYRYG